MTDQELFARLTDVEALAATLFGECRGEPLSGQAAVACVVRNRVKDPRWPNTYKDVCLQAKQFSCWSQGRDANSQAVRVVAERLVVGDCPDAAMAELLWLAAGVIDGVVLDHSRAANHYLTETIYRLATPTWTRAMREVARIGGHVFLRG